MKKLIKKGLCIYERNPKSNYKDEDCPSCIHNKNKNNPCPYIVKWSGDLVENYRKEVNLNE